MQLFYINLAARPDRRAAMAAQFERLGLAATRIEAVTPADLAAAETARYCDPRRYHWLTELELACSKSHLRAFEAILSGNAPFGAVFEDDVVLSARLPAFLAAFDAAPPAVDVLRLEADTDPLRVSPAEPARIGGVALRTVHSWSNGAAGYVISRRAAARVLATGMLLERQTDRALFNPYEPLLRHGLTLLHADPALCIQLERLPGHAAAPRSDLAAGRSQRTELERALFPRRVLHDLREAVDRDVRIGLRKAWHQYFGGAAKRVIPFAED